MMESYNGFSAKENILIGFSHPIRILTMVGLVGLEPMTSTMSSAFPAVRRLVGNPYKSTVCACLLVWKGGKMGVKISGFWFGIPPDLHIKIRLEACDIRIFSGNHRPSSQSVDSHQSTFNHLRFNFEERVNTLSVNIHTSSTQL